MLGICLVSCLLETFSWSGRWQLILGQRGRDSRVLATKLERAKELLQSRKPFGKPPDPEDLEKQYAELHEAIAEFELERGIVGLPRVGDMVRGHVVDFDEIGALVDIGAKTNAHLPVSEMSLQPTVNVSSIVQLGQTITCKVVGMWQRYIPIVSLKSAAIKSTWKQINHLRDMDEAFEVVVKEAFKSGAICDAFGLQAFLPSSHSLSELNADLKGTRIMVSTTRRGIP